MSLDKAIYYGKEHRKPYTKSKAFDTSCRNHGSCSYCEDARTYKKTKTELESLQDIREYFDCSDYFVEEEFNEYF